VLHEDIPVTIPAHFAARSVDVLADTVYPWRLREARSPAAGSLRARSRIVSPPSGT
jgi:hypothetical protein